MPHLSDFLAILWINFSASLPVQIFFCSAILLFIGLFLLSWMNAHHLAFLNPVPISVVERTHPHLPSFQAIVVIFLSCTALLIVAVETMSGKPPFTGQLHWMYLAAFFLLSGTAGVLGELHWRGARNTAFAVITGTALAFLVIVLQFEAFKRSVTQSVLLLSLVVLVAVFAWRNLFRAWTHQTKAVVGLVFFSWIFFGFF